MNKHDFVVVVSDQLHKPKKEVGLVIDTFLNEIMQCLKNDQKVTLTNFGTFEKSQPQVFDIYSPHDGTLLKNVKQYRVHFKTSPHLKKLLSGKL